MAAIRTEVPGISFASTSIGLCHGVLGSYGRFWANCLICSQNTRGVKRNKCSELSERKVIEESRNSP